MGSTELLHTLTTTLCLLAKRWLLLADEVEKLDAMLDALIRQHAGRLREQFGVGPQTAAVLLSTALLPKSTIKLHRFGKQRP